MIDAREPLRALHARAETAARAILARVFKYEAKTEKAKKVREQYLSDMKHIAAFMNAAEIYMNQPPDVVYAPTKVGAQYIAPEKTPKKTPEKTPEPKLTEADREWLRAESIWRAKDVWHDHY